MRGLAAGLLAVALLPFAAHADEMARAWLQRMGESVSTRTYEGEFLVESARGREQLRILHRARDGRVLERLVATSGSRREVIRDGDEVVAYLPDQRVAVIERRSGPTALLGNLPRFGPDVEQHYELSLGERTPSVLGGQARLLSVRPRDGYRFGFRIWIDERTAMPMRTEMVDSNGRVFESMAFTRLEMPGEIPDAEFEPAVDPRDFRWIKQGQTPGRPQPGWRAVRMPPGFRLSLATAQVMPGAAQPVTHLVYTDGVASISVFIQEPPRDKPARTSSGTIGAASAFSTVVSGWQVTAVGEVPPETLRLVAAGMQQDGRQARSAP